MKLFSEIHSTYYQITEKILKRKSVTKADIMEIIREYGFSETMLFLEPELTGENGYGLLKKNGGNFESILKKEPHVPLSLLEKSWLCSVLKDPKSNLFLDKEQKLQLAELLGTDALYQNRFISFFDQYSDGDDFENPEYIQHFRKILKAAHEKRLIKISFQTRKGNRITHYFLPVKIEYSEKNNKLRVYVNRYKDKMITDTGIINVSQITLTELTDIKPSVIYSVPVKKKTAHIRILNERNAVNRFMMEFAELEKESVYDEDTGECLVALKYDEKNEAEMIIRFLSFGPVIEVTSPADIREQIRIRIEMQKTRNDSACSG